MTEILKNKQAWFHYTLLDEYEAGLVLSGFEVKAVRQGKISLRGAFISLRTLPNGAVEPFLVNAHISPYQPKNTAKNYDPCRPRKLLLKKREIASLIGKTKQKGLTLVPISVYTKHGRVKLKFALARGKKKADKREILKKRDIEREIRQNLKLEA